MASWTVPELEKIYWKSELKLAQKSVGKSVPKIVYSGTSSMSSPAGWRGDAKSGVTAEYSSCVIEAKKKIFSRRSAGKQPANVYLRKARSTGSLDLSTLHWSGTRCRMNSLALVRPSPVAHRSKMSRTGLSMQSNCVIFGYHGTHTQK